MKLRKPDFRGLAEELRHFDARRAGRRALDAAQEGWYLAGDGPSRDRLRLLSYNYTANVVANMIGGSFFTGLLILMQADDSFIGAMTMIATAANMLQLFAPLLLERFEKRKKLLVTLRLVMQVFNVLVIGLIPLFPGPKQARLAMVAVSVLIVNVINAVMAPGFTVWHIQSIPGNVRKPFFSLITMTVGALVALCNLLSSFLVDAFKANGLEYWGLLLLRVLAFGLVLFEFRQLSRVSEYPYERTEGRLSVRKLLIEPFRNRVYLRTVLVVFLWNVTANLPGSYYTVYLLKDVQVSYTYIMTVNLINVPIVLCLTPVWGKLLRKLGWFRTLACGMTLYLLHYVGLAFVTKGTLVLYPITLIFAFFVAIGINLSFTGIPYVNIPQKDQTAYIGFYSTAANLAALLGVTCGRWFIQMTGDLTVSVLGFQMGSKQLLVLLTGALMLLATLGIFWIRRGLPGEGEA